MSVAKAQFRVVESICKGGVRRGAGFVFVAGTKGVHVQRWLAQGKIAVCGPVESTSKPPQAKAKPDRAARALGLLVLAGFLLLAVKVAETRREPDQPNPLFAQRSAP